MIPVTELRALIVLGSMLMLPGWAALSLSNLWRQWKTLQRWIVAVGLSIAFYPAFFYGMRSVLPFLTLGPYKMGALSVAFAAVIAWRMRKHWREQFALDSLEWIAVAVFGMTLFTRFWIIRDHPYPAWSDSLHHALLTRLTAVQGQLPKTMEPYFPIPLDQYHLGLYALTATTQWLAQVPAHTALLWTAQVLNGLCGLGVYLVLDRKVGRVGAIVGAVTVGLLSHQPAFYVNWGRFTQLASQTILLIAWLVTWEALKAWKLLWREHRARILVQTGLAALLTGGVFLLHFRVAVFYISLLAISVSSELWKGYKERQFRPTVLGIAVVGLASLLVAAPAIVEAIPSYFASAFHGTAPNRTTRPLGEAAEAVRRYYEFPWRTVPYLAGHVWLLIVAGLGAAIGLRRRNRLVVASLVWGGFLYLFGRAYVLSVPLLNFTNLGAVLIMCYLPIGLVMGSATEEVLETCQTYWPGMASVTLALALLGGFAASHVRVEDIEPHRFFVTPEDVEAMAWIRQNTPEHSRFAVNTYFWLPRAPHGTDAGYWIPYFTGRRTTAGTMINNLGGPGYHNKVVEMSRRVEDLETSHQTLEELEAMDVDYLYIGRNGDFSGPGLNADRLSRATSAEISYQNGGVFILMIGTE